MIKCKIAMENLPMCGKDICCCMCDEKDTCNNACEDTVEECVEAVEELDELQVMEKALPNRITEVTDLMVQVKKAEEQIDKIKAELLKAMEEAGIKKFENEKVLFTYVAPTTRKTLDKDKLQKEHPEINLDDFQKSSKVKASVRIKVK